MIETYGTHGSLCEMHVHFYLLSIQNRWEMEPRKKGVKMRIGFIWLRIWSRSGLLKQRTAGLCNDAFPWLAYLTSVSTTHCPLSSTALAYRLKSEIPWLKHAVGTQMLLPFHDTGDYFDLRYIYRHRAANKLVTSICTSSPFPRRDKHPQLTRVLSNTPVVGTGLSKARNS
jgi:hypothetical protein